ncbi:MAG: hypothetical protein QOF98_2272, partial [Streptomyces sp.]|nr:hypothetical protein [Streptomyces sp.]
RLRRLADGGLALEAAIEVAQGRHPRPALAPLAHDVVGAMVVIATAERNGDAAAALPRLRAEHDAFSASEPDDSLVVQETDRIVHAVDTLGHLLRAPAA